MAGFTYAEIEIQLMEKDGKDYVLMAHNGSSGWKKEFKDMEDLRQTVADYVEVCYQDEKI